MIVEFKPGSSLQMVLPTVLLSYTLTGALRKYSIHADQHFDERNGPLFRL
jgi:hypothetical protein